MTDNDGAKDTATVTVSVDDVNDAPVAIDDAVTTSEDTSQTIDVTDNDYDVDGTIDPTTVEIVNNPANGTLVNNVDGTVTYTPNADFNGPDSFTYTVQDDDGATSNEATVIIGVDDINDAPVAVDDAASTAEDTSQVIDVTGNDYEIDGTIVAWDVTVQATNGAVANNGDGNFT